MRVVVARRQPLIQCKGWIRSLEVVTVAKSTWLSHHDYRPPSTDRWRADEPITDEPITDKLATGPRWLCYDASVPASEPAIETIGLGRRYGRRWALVDVGIVIQRGSAVMVAGRNGSGKSTLLRILSTAIRPDHGTVRVEGFDSRSHRYEIRNRVALLSHYSYLYESLSAFENLQVVARLLHLPSRRQDLVPFLARVHLEKRADDAVMTFSAGMRKRLSIARVLLQEAPVVLLDEPYGQLDPAGFVFVDRMVEELVKGGATVLMATHQVDRAVSLCGEGVMLDGGRVIGRGSSEEIARGSRAAVEREEPRAWS